MTRTLRQILIRYSVQHRQRILACLEGKFESQKHQYLDLLQIGGERDLHSIFAAKRTFQLMLMGPEEEQKRRSTYCYLINHLVPRRPPPRSAPRSPPPSRRTTWRAGGGHQAPPALTRRPAWASSPGLYPSPRRLPLI